MARRTAAAYTKVSGDACSAGHTSCSAKARKEDPMSKVITIDAAQARQKSQRGEALLVCAYEDVDRCREILLDGAIPLAALEERLSRLTRDAEIIFFCDTAGEEEARARVAEYRKRGFENARVLQGGTREWKLSGYPLAAETEPENPAAPA